MEMENLTLQELEQLSQAYVDCRLSRLQERELELVLIRTHISSPVIDEARALMDIATRMDMDVSEDACRKNTRPRILKYTGIVAAIAVIVVCGIALLHTYGHLGKTHDVYVCVDGEVLSGHIAQSIVSETEEESMAMLRAIIEDSEIEQYLSTQYMNSIIE